MLLQFSILKSFRFCSSCAQKNTPVRTKNCKMNFRMGFWIPMNHVLLFVKFVSTNHLLFSLFFLDSFSSTLPQCLPLAILYTLKKRSYMDLHKFYFSPIAKFISMTITLLHYNYYHLYHPQHFHHPHHHHHHPHPAPLTVFQGLSG